MKGVSSVIAIILILMISISLTTLSYIFLSGTVSTTTATSSQAAQRLTSSLLAEMKIESFDVINDVVYVKNSGRVNITEFHVYVNDILDNGATPNPDTIGPGEVTSISLTSLDPGDSVKVSSSNNLLVIRVVPGGVPSCGDGSCDVAGGECNSCPGECTLNDCCTEFNPLGDPSCNPAIETSGNCDDCVVSAVCGNGVPEGTEACDDGDTLDCDIYPGCNADCTAEQRCGNNVRDCSEQCDGTDKAACGPQNCIAVGQPNECTCETAPGVIGFWKFEDNTLDSSGNGNNGINNGVSFVDGLSGGRAAYFDGSDYITFSASNNVSSDVAGGNLTVSVWLNSTSTSSQQFVAAFNTLTGNNRLMFGHQGGNNVIEVYDSTFHTGSTPVIDNTWHHVAYVLDNSHNIVTVYVDGDYEFEFSSGASIASNDLFTMGQEYDNGPVTSDFFVGALDEVKIWNIALDYTAIQAEYALNAPSPPGGMVGFWNFDGNALDSSGNGNDGTLNGGTWFTKDSMDGQAVDFDGVSDYVRVPDDSTLDGTSMNYYTLSAWVKPRSFPTYQRIIHKNGAYNMFISDTRHASCGHYGGSWQYVQASSVTLQAHQWYHIACVYNKTHLSVYVNGVYRNALAKTDDTPDSGDPLIIGLDEDLSTYDLNGIIDEAKIWNKVLTPAEIQAEYSADLPSSLLFGDGFGSGDFTAWTGSNQNGDATISVVSSPFHSGTYSAQTNNLNADGEYAYYYKNIAGQSTIFARTYFQLSPLPPAAGNEVIILRFAGSGDILDGRVENSGGSSWIIHGGRYLNGEWGGYSSSTISINPGEWHWLELKAVICPLDQTNGQYVIYYDSTVPLVTINGNTSGRGNVNQVRVGGTWLVNPWSTTVTVDDVVVSNTQIGP